MLDITPAARLLARRRSAPLDPLEAQVAVLRGLVSRATGTRFGRAHRFAEIRSVRDFRAAVPLRSWDAFWTEWWQQEYPVLSNVTWPGRIGFFAETSGTTGRRAKPIPVSREMVRSNRRAALDLVLDHIAHTPSSRFFGGQSLMLGGSSRLTRLAPGVHSGDLSGIVAATMPAWTRGRALPPRAIALLGDWDEKLARIARDLPGRDLRCISGTPSWLLLLFERLLERTDARDLAALFPGLELVIHGGVGFAPYRARFAELLGRGVRTREVYPASEGFIAHEDGATGLRLILDNGLFYEFVPVDQLAAANPVRHWIGNAEIGRDYALVLSTNAGLFGYVLGDIVRLLERDPPRLVVVGRTAQMLSAFGEHVSVGELDRAMSAAAEEAGVSVIDYAVTPIHPDGGDARGGHLFAVECAGGATADPAAFARTIERVLAAGNDDYASHRAGGAGLRPTEVRFVPRGRFNDWMRSRGKLGGQHKVPRVLACRDDLGTLIDEGTTS